MQEHAQRPSPRTTNGDSTAERERAPTAGWKYKTFVLGHTFLSSSFPARAAPAAQMTFRGVTKQLAGPPLYWVCRRGGFSAARCPQKASCLAAPRFHSGGVALHPGSRVWTLKPEPSVRGLAGAPPPPQLAPCPAPPAHTRLSSHPALGSARLSPAARSAFGSAAAAAPGISPQLGSRPRPPPPGPAPMQAIKCVVVGDG